MLAPAPGSHQIDATLGGGGHAERILEASDPDGRLLGLDADGAAIARVRARLGAAVRRPAAPPPGELPRARRRWRPRRASTTVDGCLFDLGLSSFQLADADRGFGFRTGGPLDMRFDTDRGVPAAELLATLDAGRADRALPALRRGAVRGADRPGDRGGPPDRPRRHRGGARRARRPRCPRAARRAAPRSIPPPASSRRCGSPSTRSSTPSQAGLAAAVDLLRPGGRLVVLSYHSLEDRIVKRFLQAERRGCICPPEAPVCVCGRQATTAPAHPTGAAPTAAEIAANPRARSARLRAAERLAA